jgi:transposase
MPFTSTLPDEFYQEDLISLCKTEPIAQVRLRYIVLSHIQDGKSIEATARMVRSSTRAVTNWISRYKNGGLEALKNQPGRGAKRRLSSDMESKFCNRIREEQNNRNGGRLRGEDIKKILHDEFGVECSLSSTYGVLKRVGMSWITSRSRHPKQSHEEQELFKKLREIGSKCSQCGHSF